MTTIVSAFMSNVNSRTDRDINSYYLLGRLLLKSTTPKIIFLDEPMYDLIQPNDYNEENTLIIKCNKNDNYLYKYVDKLYNFKLNTDNPLKDTLEYMFTMCNKTEWIRKAIENDIFNSNNFIWIDFGIKQVCNWSEDIFIQKLDNLYYKKYEKVRIGNIWNLSMYYNVDILNEIAWYFAGGVFGGNKRSLIYFADLMKKKCVQIIEKHNTLAWEVNIWYILYTEQPNLFYPYLCNHSNSIIENY